MPREQRGRSSAGLSCGRASPDLPHGSCSDCGPPDPWHLDSQPRGAAQGWPILYPCSLAQLSLQKGAERRASRQPSSPSSGRRPLPRSPVLQGPPVDDLSMRTGSPLAGRPLFSVGEAFSCRGAEHGVPQSSGAMSALCIGNWTPRRLAGQLTALAAHSMTPAWRPGISGKPLAPNCPQPLQGSAGDSPSQLAAPSQGPAPPQEAPAWGAGWERKTGEIPEPPPAPHPRATFPPQVFTSAWRHPYCSASQARPLSGAPWGTSSLGAGIRQTWT